MSRIIDSKLSELSTLIYEMGGLAYQAVSMAVEENLHGGDSYNSIREISDMLIMLADQIEDKAFEIIVRFQPVASDLRMIKSYMKISYDFTRFGRYALDISYINRRFGGLKECKEWVHSYILEVGERVLNMMKISIEALKSQKIEVAKSVAEMEDDVDRLCYDFLDKIVGDRAVESKNIVSSVLIIRYIERIADHVAYICESIIYALTGRKEFLR